MSYIAKNGRLYTSGASEALTLLDDKFSVNKSYSKGDSCIYNDYLWKFTSDKLAGEWDSSVVEQCRIMDFVDDINGRLDNLGTITKIDKSANNGFLAHTFVYKNAIVKRFKMYDSVRVGIGATPFTMCNIGAENAPFEPITFEGITDSGVEYILAINTNGDVTFDAKNNIAIGDLLYIDITYI